MNGHTFCRNYLKEIMKEVRQKVDAKTIKNAWAYKYSGERNVEFQINVCPEAPEGFYWFGQGCCLWCAKSKGWESYLETLKEKKGE